MATWFFDEQIRTGLKRMALGLQVRAILAAVGIPLWTWAVENRHPGQAWIEGAFWIIAPLADLLMTSGAYRIGAKAGGVALIITTVLDLYAATVGLSGSVIGLEQVPFATSGAELMAIIGTVSVLAWLRGPIEDIDHDYLEGRIYRAMTLIVVGGACALMVRAVMWQGMFEGLAALIVAGSVVALMVLALMAVIRVLRLAADSELVKERPPARDAAERPDLVWCAVPADAVDDLDPPSGRPRRDSADDLPAIPGYHHLRSQRSEHEHD